MKKYYLLADSTSFADKATIRLVDSARWLESRYVSLLKVYETKDYVSARQAAKADGYEVR